MIIEPMYTDEELRVLFLPHAIALVNQEVYRARNECNTSSMAALVSELINIVRHGSATGDKEAETEAPAPTKIKKAKAMQTNSPKFG